MTPWSLHICLPTTYVSAALANNTPKHSHFPHFFISVIDATFINGALFEEHCLVLQRRWQSIFGNTV
jgi:hypothetical protein